MSNSIIIMIIHILVVAVVISRVILRPHREPAARIAWIAVIASLPIIGIISYIYFGEVNVGRKHVAKMREILANMPSMEISYSKNNINYPSPIPKNYENIFKLGKSISGFDPIGGNSTKLMENSNAMVEALVADIDSAEKHVHVLFYIWLPDISGRKVVEALKRAAGRGVQCRAMADNMGSQAIIRSKYWIDMENEGVHLAIVLPIFSKFSGRVDLRNHRKIVVIDDVITYCGSQNCADEEFLPKSKFAPWVDAVLRLEGPIARQNQYLFASDWMTATNENITELLCHPVVVPQSGVAAQVIGTGPTDRHLAMSQMFVSLITSARRELIITTPYFVPNEPIMSALQAASYRGVNTILVLPEKNDSWIVQCASRSYYSELLNAGIKIYEFKGGLLHTKSLTIDGDFSMIGSANVDRRSFDLNYENNMLIHSKDVTCEITSRQQEYISNSNLVTTSAVNSWSMSKRLLNNAVSVLGPIL